MTPKDLALGSDFFNMRYIEQVVPKICPVIVKMVIEIPRQVEAQVGKTNQSTVI